MKETLQICLPHAIALHFRGMCEKNIQTAINNILTVDVLKISSILISWFLSQRSSSVKKGRKKAIMP